MPLTHTEEECTVYYHFAKIWNFCGIYERLFFLFPRYYGTLLACLLCYYLR